MHDVQEGGGLALAIDFLLKKRWLDVLLFSNEIRAGISLSLGDVRLNECFNGRGAGLGADIGNEWCTD